MMSRFILYTSSSTFPCVSISSVPPWPWTWERRAALLFFYWVAENKSILIPLQACARCWKSRASETGIARYHARGSEAIRFLVAQQVRDCSTIFLRLLVVWLLLGGERLECDDFPVDATALWTSSGINYERLFRTTHHDEWWQRSCWCLRHRSLHRAYLRIPLFIYWFSSLVNQ
jgi:hypothetical protein